MPKSPSLKIKRIDALFFSKKEVAILFNKREFYSSPSIVRIFTLLELRQLERKMA